MSQNQVLFRFTCTSHYLSQGWKSDTQRERPPHCVFLILLPLSLIWSWNRGRVPSLLRYASQDVFHRVGKGRKADYNKQVRQSSAQESVVPIGLLEARVVSGSQRHVPVEERQPVLAVMRFPVGDDVGQREGRGPAVEFFLRLLLLLDFLR